MYTFSHTPNNIRTQKDFNVPMKIEDIYQIEIELLNVCNLNCPLCSRNNIEIKEFVKNKSYLDLDKLKDVLLEFPNLKKVHLVGSLCEPTLYPHFFDLIIFLKTYNINIMISTNASVWNEKKWRYFGTLLTKEDEVRFAIDGSTQNNHEIYRKGSNLEKVVKNFLAFSDSKAFKVLQTLKFKHNEAIYEQEIEDILQMCNHKFDFVYRLSTNSENKKLGLEYPKLDNLKTKLYKRIFEDALKNKHKLKTSDEIDCFSREGFIYINYKGNFITCCDRYEEFIFNKEGLELPSIYNFNKEYLLKFLNDIYKEVPNTLICIKHCHKLVQTLEQDRDILLDKKMKKGAFNEK